MLFPAALTNSLCRVVVSPPPLFPKKPPDSVYTEIKKKAKDAVLKLIECERDGEQINRPLVKNVLGIFQEVGMSSMEKYETDFEDFLLAETAAFYQRKATVWVQVRSPQELRGASRGCCCYALLSVLSA